MCFLYFPSNYWHGVLDAFAGLNDQLAGERLMRHFSFSTSQFTFEDAFLVWNSETLLILFYIQNLYIGLISHWKTLYFLKHCLVISISHLFRWSSRWPFTWDAITSSWRKWRCADGKWNLGNFGGLCIMSWWFYELLKKICTCHR